MTKNKQGNKGCCLMTSEISRKICQRWELRTLGSLILIDVIQQLACQTREMSLSLGNHLALKANSSAINCDIKGQKGAKKSAFVRSCEERRKRNQSRLSQLRSTDKQDNGSKLFSRFKCARRRRSVRPPTSDQNFGLGHEGLVCVFWMKRSLLGSRRTSSSLFG